MKTYLLDVVSTSGILQPERLEEYCKAVEAALPPHAYEGVVAIGGRLPVWAYSAFLHRVAHPAVAGGTFEPRMDSIIITMGHQADAPTVGSILPAPKPEEWIKVTLP